MSNLTSIAIAVVVLLYVLARQVQRRPVREDRRPVVLLVLLAVGVYQVAQFVGQHPVNGTAVATLVASLVLGAGLGAVRAYTVRLWRDGGVLYRQGGALTVALWLVAIGAHFGVDLLIDHDGSARGLASAALLLYVAVSFGSQRLVVAARAAALPRAAV